MGDAEPLPEGIVYTETVVYAAPESLAAEAPYQIAIVDLEDGSRRTVRVLAQAGAPRARIGDPVKFTEYRDGVACFELLAGRKDGPR